MSELYSQQEISEMLKELQIEKEKAQNMAEAYYRMNAINYDLNLHINEANKQIKIYKKALYLAIKDNKNCPLGKAYSCDKHYECNDCCTSYYLQKARDINE